MSESQAAGRLAAEVYLDALGEAGIDYLFVNPGTDFPPIVEAYSRPAGNRPRPKPMLIPHENAAVCMAHGVTMVSGRPQGVMVHVNVGTANTLNALIDASRDRIPMLLSSGRTPITETGPAGTRSGSIHWAQEMFDQAGMLREIVKWDYELRRPEQIADVVDRAMEVMTTSPAGPVYLSLPRETLSEVVTAEPRSRGSRSRARAPSPSPDDIATLAGWIAAARMPLIVTGAAGRFPEDSRSLGRLAEAFAIPVMTAFSRYFALPSSHPMFLGSNNELLAEADLVIVLEADVPWIPSKIQPNPKARIVQVGEDPTYERYPIRSFTSDMTVRAGTGAFLAALHAALDAAKVDPGGRRDAVLARSDRLRVGWAAEAKAAGGKPNVTIQWLCHCLKHVLSDDAIVVSEYAFRQEWCPLETPGTFFGLSSAGGLGWGLGAALGAKLAAPTRQVVAFLGDGAYMFANPTACHWAAQGHDLPILTILYNNLRYGAVRGATLDMFKTGSAAADNGMLLADLSPSPAFEKIIEAHGGLGLRVDSPDALLPALKEAVAAVAAGRQALVNVVCRD